MHQVLLYLLRSNKPLVPEEEIADMLQWEQLDWQKYAEECKGMIVTNPGMVRPPECLRLNPGQPLSQSCMSGIQLFTQSSALKSFYFGNMLEVSLVEGFPAVLESSGFMSVKLLGLF